MMFTQQVHFQGNGLVDREFDKICKEHPSCEGCPLREDSMKISESAVTCITGKMKGRERNDG